MGIEEKGGLGIFERSEIFGKKRTAFGRDCNWNFLKNVSLISFFTLMEKKFSSFGNDELKITWDYVFIFMD